MSPNSDLLADTLSNGALAIVNLRTGHLAETFPARDGSVADAVSFLPDGHTVVDGGSNGHVTLWNLSTRRATQTLRFAEFVRLTAPIPTAGCSRSRPRAQTA